MVSKVICIGWTVLCIVGFFAGINAAEEVVDSVSAPTANSGPEIGIAVEAISWLTFWVIVIAPTALLGLLFRQSGSPSVANKAVAACLAFFFGVLTVIALFGDYVPSDDAAGGAATATTVSAAKPTWQLSRSTSQIKGTQDVFLYLDANETIQGLLARERPLLVAQCYENKTSVYIDWKVYMGVQTTMVEYRLDEQRAQSVTAAVSSDSKATFFPKPMGLLRQLATADELTARATPYSDSPATITFNIKGMESHLKHLRDACGW